MDIKYFTSDGEQFITLSAAHQHEIMLPLSADKINLFNEKYHFYDAKGEFVTSFLEIENIDDIDTFLVEYEPIICIVHVRNDILIPWLECGNESSGLPEEPGWYFMTEEGNFYIGYIEDIILHGIKSRE